MKLSLWAAGDSVIDPSAPNAEPSGGEGGVELWRRRCLDPGDRGGVREVKEEGWPT